VNAATGGAGGYTYNWTPGNPTGDGTVSVTGLSAGTWTCTATDANGCTTSTNFTITQPTGLALTPASQTNISCNGGSNGAASVNAATGGAGGYTYNWTPGNPTGDGSVSVTGLSAGTWTCTATDANGCTTSTNFTITQPTALALTPASQTNISCNGGSNGAASVNAATGGAGGYTYNWTPGNPTGDGSVSVTGLSAGTWTCTATDANGCTTSTNFTITEPTALVSSASAQTNVSCNGGSNGSATVAASAGTGTYAYAWSPSGGTSATATGLTAGLYTVNVTDVNGCNTSTNFTITEPTALVATSSGQTNVTCYGLNDGSASVAVSGGTGTYAYAWSPSGGTSATATGLTAGLYTVNVTDVNGCSTSTNFTITEPTALVATSSGQANVTCYGLNDGSASVAVSGGTGAYTYIWTPGNPAGGTTATATGLSAGTYAVSVSDANGCSTSLFYTITQNSEIEVQLGQLTNVSCFNGNDGALSVQATGGTGGYSYLWNNGTGNTLTGLSAGTYQVTVNDNSLCSVSESFIVSQPTLLTVAIQPSLSIVCFGQSNATASATASGGTSGYAYVWSPNGANTNTISNIGAGTYSVQVTDANGCNANDTVTIASAPTPQVEAGANINQCGNQQVTLSASGANYYTWNDAVQNNTPFTPNFGTTSYIVTGTDTLGCSATDIVYVTANQIPDASISLVNNIQLLASPANANYQWIDCNTSNSILGANNSLYEATENGSFAVIVTSTEGCADTSDCFVVDQVGMNDSYSLLKIEMYPNPAHDAVTLSFNVNEKVDLSFLNAQGQIVQRIENVNSGETIALSHLAKGMYVIQINTSFGKELKRLIIE
jgi:hypothetical protein